MIKGGFKNNFLQKNVCSGAGFMRKKCWRFRFVIVFYLLPVLKRESLVCWFAQLTVVFDTLHCIQSIGTELRTGLIGWLRSCHCFPIPGLV